MNPIADLKKHFGNRLLIAAHHYQRKEIIAFADIIGDSYKLAVEAGRLQAEYIVLCGVRFMAESASILAGEKQIVLLPDYDAGCPMADMIDLSLAKSVLQKLNSIKGNSVIPITYMNSWADIKAFTGRENGSICTSGNARKIVSYYLEQGKSVFFLPDFNLGYNTARELGIKDEQICTIEKDGKISTTNNPENANIFLWDGFCKVHKVFKPSDISETRTRFPGIKVLVHPECRADVVDSSDFSGSTEAMYREIRDSRSGTSFAVGTEARFIERMIELYPEKNIYPLRTSICQNMNRIDLNNLLETLESIIRHEATGEKLMQITVSPSEKTHAKKALDNMVRIAES